MREATKPRRLRCGGAALLLLAALPGLAWAQPSADHIRIGGLFSLSGGSAALSQSGSAGVRMAIAEINAAGGILGKPVDLVPGDDQSDPTIAVGDAKRLVFQEKIQMAAGPMSSITAIPLTPVLNEAHVMAIDDSGALAMDTHYAPYHFSIVPSATNQARGFINYIADVRHAHKAAALLDSSANSHAIAEVLRAEGPKRGITWTGIQFFDNNATDVTPQLLALRRGEPEVLIHSGVSTTDVGVALKNIAELGWNVQVTTAATLVGGVAAVKKLAGDDIFDKVNAVGWDYRAFTYCTNDPVGSSPFAAFITRLKAAEGAHFAQLSPSIAAWYYDGVYILKAAAEGAHSTDGAAMAAWLEKNAGSVKAVIGHLTAGPDDHWLIGPDELVMVERADRIRSDGLHKRAGC